jgi:predicted ATPase
VGTDGLIATTGVGKTRLALAVAAACQDRYADGAAFVPLAGLGTPALLADTIAHGIGSHGGGDRRPEEALVAHLRDRQRLLVLDNFEHLLPAAPLLADLLAACPRLALLVTSGTLVHVRGERALPVPPLPLPDAAALPPVEALAVTPAVALFVERAHALRPDFALTPENAGDVAANLQAAGRVAAGHRAGRGARRIAAAEGAAGPAGAPAADAGGRGARPSGAAADPARRPGLEL